MARSQSPPILAQLRNARTLPEQTAALRSLKNEIIGHVPKKETWIGLGVLEPITNTLWTASNGGRSSKMNGKEARLPILPRPLSEEENVRLQALQLVASFANGGPRFLAPLHAARVLPALLANLSPFTNPPQIVVATLRALTDISNAAALAAPGTPLNVETLADSIFSSQHLDSFSAMLSFSSDDPLRQSQVTLAAGLVFRLCCEERHQQTLTMAGILDALSTRLASFAVARGHVIPGALSAARKDGLIDAFPDPAPHNSKLTPVLEAISVIVGDSQYRAYRLMNSPSILATFPSIKFDATNEMLESMEYGGSKHSPHVAMQYLLPTTDAPLSVYQTVPLGGHQGTHQPRLLSESQSQSSSRTSLNRLSSASVWESLRFQTASPNGDADNDEGESPFIPWLVFLVRSSEKYERLLAASVLATVAQPGLAKRTIREASIGLLVVPPLVNMIAKPDREPIEAAALEDPTKRALFERGPAIIARLILDSEYLQRSAYECGVVPVLTKLLKHAYEPTPDNPQPSYWSSNPDTGMDVESTSPLAQLGEEGQNETLLHRIKVRESTLKAIAALAGGREDFRKAFVAEEILPYVFESLQEFPRKPSPAKDRGSEGSNNEGPRSVSKGYGVNPVSVLIAGCHTVRMLSRSVSILRTALVDHGTAMPVLGFLKHPDINVQIAAAAAMANLVLEVSPVREPLTEHGVMKILCEQARSQNAALRLNAIWALKHFVDAVGSDLKKACLQELQTEHLISMIRDDTEDAALQNQQRTEMSGFDLDDDVDMQPSDEPHRWMYGSNGVLRELDSTHSTKLRQAEDRLAAVREAELNPVRRARNDDMAIQEQALNFVRNLIGRPEQGTMVSGESTAMINHLLNELGEKQFFELLTSKLRTKVLHPFSRRSAVTGRETRVVYPQAKIVAAVTYILVHIAASVPRHREILIRQPELLKLLAQQSSSKDKEVRLALCHLTFNLTCKEDESEAEGCEMRTHELRKLGYHSKMENLKNMDQDLDVRERAKAASFQMQAVTN